MNNLKPCPFCGIPVSSKDHGRYIICNDAECILGGDWIDTIGCINNWNKRYTEDKLRAEVERLRDILEHSKDLSEHIIKDALMVDALETAKEVLK